MSERQETSSSSVATVKYSVRASAVTPLLRAREVRPTLDEVLGRSAPVPVPPLALMAAEVFPALKESLRDFGPRTTLSRSGEICLSFVRDRKHAVLTADADGELTLLLTNRTTDDEPEAAVVGPDALSLRERIAQFLGH